MRVVYFINRWCVLEPTDPPPSYRSVVQRVKAAKQNSTSKAGFVKALFAIFVGTGMLPKTARFEEFHKIHIVGYALRQQE